MPAGRDVEAFEERAARYEHGWLGQLHREIVDRATAIALASHPSPSRILDVGCGTGYQLRLLAHRCPDAVELAGIDPAPAMVEVAQASAADPRIAAQMGFAEQLPYVDDAFDLVLSTTSFDHWADQRAGLRECARVLAADGRLVLVDLFSAFLIPTLVGARRTKARTKARANRLLAGEGLHPVGWQHVHPLINAVVAAR